MAEQKYPQGLPWKWHPKSERDERNGSIFSMKHPGHAYAVAMQPSYVENDQWAQDAALIVRAVNSHDALVKALRLVAEHDTVMARLEPDAHDAILTALALCEQGEL